MRKEASPPQVDVDAQLWCSTLLFVDYVQTADGKLFVLGAGWEYIDTLNLGDSIT